MTSGKNSEYKFKSEFKIDSLELIKKGFTFDKLLSYKLVQDNLSMLEHF
jgi:hypothetical protein